ncbi:MAG: hypothetical protein M0017_11400 [Desulfobacteraceae bacterium]|nr:hypothetical protein [Desulfobacteraceae bacterium]
MQVFAVADRSLLNIPQKTATCMGKNRFPRRRAPDHPSWTSKKPLGDGQRYAVVSRSEESQEGEIITLSAPDCITDLGAGTVEGVA